MIDKALVQYLIDINVLRELISPELQGMLKAQTNSFDK